MLLRITATGTIQDTKPYMANYFQIRPVGLGTKTFLSLLIYTEGKRLEIRGIIIKF